MRATKSFLFGNAIFFIIIFSASSCKKETENTSHQHIYFGQQTALGTGTVQTFASISHEGVPEEIGLTLSNNVFTSLPANISDYMLELPERAQQVTPFKHVSFSWLPAGHPPAVFSVPHFDTHFYILSHAEQMLIPAPDATNQTLFAAPPDGYLPEDYTVPFAAVPMMGRHWIDKTSPVQPVNSTEPFMQEFMWGTYNRKVAFLEPMIAKAFIDALKSGTVTEVHKTIKQPRLFDQTGTYQPTRYNIYKDAEGNVIFSLDKFVLR
ncbi:MAG: DUF5602 domain-containing protein [Segetibacter sp.]